MADKKKAGISIMPTFVDGEQPTAAKFNSIGSQTQRATATLEYAVGDTWDESYPYSLASQARLSIDNITSATFSNFLQSNSLGRRLDIASLARLIGPASNLNPLVVSHLAGAAKVSSISSEVVPTGVHSFVLRYVPSNSPTFSQTLTNEVGAVDDLDNAGDYYIDTRGRVYSVSQTIAGTTVDYETTPATYKGGPSYIGSSFNVIPDPAQVANNNATGLVLNELNGVYTITLPAIIDQQMNILGSSTNLTNSIDQNQDMQMELPIAITMVCGGGLNSEGTSGTVIPQGMIYLRNETTEELYIDATYTYDTRSTIKVTPNEVLDLGHDYSLITVGTNITTMLLDLSRKLFTHSHDRANGESLVSINDLADIFKEAGESGLFVPSQVSSNPLPQYLHRDGTRGSDVGVNDDNALRGDLLIGRKEDGSRNATTAGNMTGAGTSYGLFFSWLPSGNKIGSWVEQDANVDGLYHWYLKSTVSNVNIRLDSLLNVEIVAAEEVTVDAPNGITLEGHTTNGIDNIGGTISRPGLGFVAPLDKGTNIAANAGWFYPKTYEIAYTVSAQRIWAFEDATSASLYFNNQDTIGMADTVNDAHILAHKIELPSWFNNANKCYVYEISALWSPENSDLEGATGYTLGTANWFGTSTRHNEDKNGGVSWQYDATDGNIWLFWNTDTNNNSGDTINPTTLDYYTDPEDAGDPDKLATNLDVRLLIKFRIGQV